MNSQSVEEAAILIKLYREYSPLLTNISPSPLNWSWDYPLCQRCWQELAETKGLCPLCNEMSDRLQSTKIPTGSAILISCPSAEEFSDTLPDYEQIYHAPLTSQLLLVLLPNTSVSEFLLSLQKYKADPFIVIVFPAQGDMNFGDSLAMARYFHTNLEYYEDGIWIKFFYSHAHMRSFDFDDFLSCDIAERLFQAAQIIKQVFYREDISVILNLLQKNEINKSYELSRFYSMCNQDQKSVLEQIQIDRLDPHRASLLLRLTKYVSRAD